MIKRTLAIGSWVFNLFNPPPLDSMTFAQKAGRVFFLGATLVVGSIIAAMVGAMGLFIMEKGRELGSMPDFFNGICIIAVGIGVNAACVYILVHLKKADNLLVPPTQTDTKPIMFFEVPPDQINALGKNAPSADAAAAQDALVNSKNVEKHVKAGGE